MIGIIIFIGLLIGFYLAIRAMVDTAQADAWEASRNMLIIALIFIVTMLYVYKQETTKDNYIQQSSRLVNSSQKL